MEKAKSGENGSVKIDRPAQSHANQLKNQGFTLFPGVVSISERARLLDALGPVTGAGWRGALAVQPVAQLAFSPLLLNLLRPHMSGIPRPVRAIYFDKGRDFNWLVAWHQDLTISVSNRIEVPGFGPWSLKEGVHHVQPPVELLENILTARLHLDDCDLINGALRVLPGSHTFGRLSSEGIQQLRKETTEVVCAALAGDVLLMRPLLLHSSGRSNCDRHRRVVHIEYTTAQLPMGLAWTEPEEPRLPAIKPVL